MAKNKKKNGNRKKGKSGKGGSSSSAAAAGGGRTKSGPPAITTVTAVAFTAPATDADANADADDDAASLFWSADDECSHYAALGCHIANVARCCGRRMLGPGSGSGPGSGQSSNNTSNPKHATTTPREYEEMCDEAMRRHPWLLGIERFDPSEYHPEDVRNIPEVAMDDGDGDGDGMSLAVTNVADDASTRVCIVTVYDVDVSGADGTVLRSGIASSLVTASSSDNDDDGAAANSKVGSRERKCTTFVVLCPPETFVHLCSLVPGQTLPSPDDDDDGGGGGGKTTPVSSWSQVEIESDVQPWLFHANVDDEHPHLLHFPFCPGVDDDHDDGEVEGGGGGDSSDDNGGDGIGDGSIPSTTAYQCTQSEGGTLTHFFHGNHHAVDFACPIGTPLYSPADGIVVEVNDKHEKAEAATAADDDGDSSDNNSDGGMVLEVSGIAARNMFRWNSIMIQVIDAADGDDDDGNDRDPLYVEFVHIQTNSCVVEAGDAVTRGQLLCRSGSVGFSPEPHLHMATYRGGGDDAATVRTRFEKRRRRRPSVPGDEGAVAGEEEAEAKAEAMPMMSFLPRAGGWYNQYGLVEDEQEA